MKTYTRIIALCALLLSTFTYCGDDEVPLDELYGAKRALAKAETMKAEKYAAPEYGAAKSEMMKAHNYLKDEKMDETKAAAIEAQKKAEAAAQKAAPLASNDMIAETEALKQKAIKANAKEFAPEEFQLGENSLALGKTAINDQKDYEKGFNELEESKENFQKSLNISMAQKSQMEQQLAEVKADIEQAEAQGAKKYAPKELALAKKNYNEAVAAMNNEDLATAAPKVAEAKKYAAIALQKTQNIAIGTKMNKAASKVAKAEALITKFKNDYATSLEIYEDAKYDLTTQEENLQAAKAALTSANTYYNNQQFEEAAKQAEEAESLANIILEQLPNIQNKLIEYMNAECPAGMKKDDEGKNCIGGDGMDDSDGDSDGDSDSDNVTTMTEKPTPPKGWKTYKVKYNPKARDCLWRIASYKYIYYNSKLWPRIYKANKSKIKNPDLIFPGQVFAIPPKIGDIDALIAEKEEYPKKLDEWYKSQEGKDTDDDNDGKPADYYVPDVNDDTEDP